MAGYGEKHTLTELVANVAEALNDSGHVYWTAAMLASAINRAIRDAGADWLDEKVDASQVWDSDTFTYTLPADMENLMGVYLEKDDGMLFTVPPTVYVVEGSSLRIRRRMPDLDMYDGQALHIVYEARPIRLLTCEASDGVVANNTITSVLADLEYVRPGDEGEIEGTAVLVTHVNVGTKTVTFTPTVANNNAADFWFAKWTTVPEPYIVNYAMAVAYETGSRAKTGMEVDEALKRGAYHRQIAADSLDKFKRPQRPVRRV